MRRRPLPQATNGGPRAVTVTSVSLDLTCVETVDPARLAPSFGVGRPKPARPPGGGRGDARHLLGPAPVELLEGGASAEVGPGESRAWRAAARLPAGAPPTLSGAAVRVAYKLIATASYQEGAGEGKGGSLSATAAAPLAVRPPRPLARPPPGYLATGDAAVVDTVRYEPGHPLPGGARLAASPARGGGGRAPWLGLGRRLSSMEGGSGGGAAVASAPAPAADGEPDATPRPPHPPPFGRCVFALRGAASELAHLTLTGPPDGQLVPGGTLRGALALRGEAECATLVRFAASLDCIERVAAPWAVGDGLARRTVADEDSGEAAHLLATSFSLTLPPHATPSVSTPLVTVTWVLRLEIGAGAAPAEGGGGGAAASSAPPPPLLEWELPLLVYAPDDDDEDEG